MTSGVATGAHATFRRTRRFGSLDGIRCLAIAPVVWHHATPHPYEGVLGRGPLGVDLFFVLSGFLITTLLLREREEGGRVHLGAFYLRRTLRIFPLYFAVLALYLVRALLRPEGDPIARHFLQSLPAYATFTANWFVDFDVTHPVAFGFAWSLSTEEQFYALWPSIVAAAGALARRITPRLALAVPVLAAVSLVVFDQLVEDGALTQLLPPASLARRVAQGLATPIALGALAALAMHHPRSFAWLHRALGARLAAPACLVALVVAVVVPAPVLPTHLVMTALVVATTLREDHGLRAILGARPIARIGVVSYGIYLLHVSCIVAARGVIGRDAPAWLVFAVALTAAWGAAELSFRTFESPIARWRPRASGSLRPPEPS